MGRTVSQIAQRLKITERAVYMALRRCQPAQAVIAEEMSREDIDAGLILTRLSDMFNADIGDIIEPAILETGEPNPKAGCYRPIHDWPAVWRRMLAGSEVKELFEHSKDGEGASWDKIGELVKIKFIDPLKLLELAMKHKAVDAMVKQGDRPLSPGEREITIRWGAASDVIDVTPPKELK